MEKTTYWFKSAILAIILLCSYSSYSQVSVTCDFIATEDTYIKLKEANNNFGSCDELIVDREQNDLHRILLQFDLSGIPASSTIISGELRLYTDNGNNMNISVFQIGATDIWEEGNLCDSSGSSNWNKRTDTSNWGTYGVVGDFDEGTPIATINGSADGIHSWPLTSLTQGWFNGTITNNGIMVGSQDGGGDRTVDYDSTEKSGGIAPVLRVTYTITLDNDGDGVYDSVDIDNDNDGIPNLSECVVEDSGHDGSYPETDFSLGIASDDPDDKKESHFLNTITLNGNTFSDFIVPNAYEADFPTVTNTKKVYLSDHTVRTYDYYNNPSFPEQILPAFQSRDINYYHAMDGANYLTSSYTLSYNNPIYSTGSVALAITERNGNNQYFVEALDAYDNVLGSISVNLTDYVDTGHRVNDWESGGMFIALFPVDDIAPLGSPISALRMTFPNSNGDGPDGKVFFFGDFSLTKCDNDGDGVPNNLDLDSDNDGIPDIVEVGLGSISEGKGTIPLSSFTDTNNNGMHDSFESNSPIDSDGDGTPNYLDLDSDNDAVFDVDEARTKRYVFGNLDFDNGDGDINGDGVGDGTESEAFRVKFIPGGCTELYGDGILDKYDYGTGVNKFGNLGQGSAPHFVNNEDNGSIPDYLDLDSNDDGVFDIEETHYAHLDGNNDGKIDDTVDSDGDGLVNSFDTNDAAFGSPRDLQGKFDLFFDGRNDYVEDTAVIDGWSEATIMGWIKIDPSASGDQIIFGQDNFYVQLNSDKTVSTFANGYSNSVTTTLNTDQWTHVAASYSNTNNSLRLYINGKIIDNVSAFGSLPADTSSFTIGRQPDTDSKYFDGYIDEVRIFFKALHIKELKKLVCQEIEDNSGTVRGLVIPTDVEGVTWANLRRYYRMDAYKDNVLDDLTTPTIDEGSGARIYNIKLIDDQSAPLPYITKQSGRLDVAVNDASKGISGGEALLNEGAIVKIAHNDVYIDSELKHTGLIIDAQDAGSNPIEFSVKNDSELNISFYLELDGKLDLEGESQLVQGKGSILDADSSGYIEKDQQGTANSYNYNYWSSSVGPIGVTGARGTASTNNDFTLSNALLDGSSADDGVYPKTINFQSSYAAADSGSSDPITLSTYWLWKYHGASDDYYAWQKIYPSTPLLPGEGYTMKGSSGSVPITSEQNYVFRGKPYNGDFTLPLTPGNDRLIGNPYPSAMDAEEFIKDNLGTTDGGNNTNGNVFNGALYFWDHFGSVDSHHLEDYVGGYATRNLIGGAPAIANDTRINATGGTGTKIPGRYIPVNQGFFVLTSLDEDLTGLTEVNGGDIVFKNSQRIFKTEATSSSVFMRNAVTDKKEDTKSPSTSARVNGNDAENESDARPLIRLNFDSPKGYHRQIVAGVDKNATNSFDLGYDALLPDLGSEDLFWTINNTQFVIQGVDNFDSDQELPLGLIVSDSGIAKIAVNKLENIDANVRLYIKDKSNDETFEITNKSFEIELDPGEYYDRFSLVFQPRLKTLDEVTLEQGINIFMNESNTLLQVNRLVDTKIESVRLFNSLGQSLNAWDSNLENRNLSLEVNNMSTGLYIVQLETIDGDIIKKMLVE